MTHCRLAARALCNQLQRAAKEVHVPAKATARGSRQGANSEQHAWQPLLCFSNERRTVLSSMGQCPPLNKEYWAYIRAEYAALSDSDRAVYEDQAKEARDQAKNLKEPAVNRSAIQDQDLPFDHGGGIGGEPLAIMDSGPCDVNAANGALVAAGAPGEASILGPYWANGGSKTFNQSKVYNSRGHDIIPIVPDSLFFRGKLQQPIKERAARFKALADGYARDRGDVPKRVMCHCACIWASRDVIS